MRKIKIAVAISVWATCYAFGPSARTPKSRCQRHSNGNRVFLRPLYADKQKKGVYVRPSAAIERGSGFFVPGLEGPRVRLLCGLTFLLLAAVNHLSGTSQSPAGFSTESLAIGSATLLLVQSAIEFGKDEIGYDLSFDDPGVAQPLADKTLIQKWRTDNVSTGWKEKVLWSASSYIALTPASALMILENQSVVFCLGFADQNLEPTVEAGGCQAALDTLSNTKSGRVSLPLTHPTVKALVPEESDQRCVVLQTIDDERCWMMTSDQLLQAFTNRDLAWLGQLATYVKS